MTFSNMADLKKPIFREIKGKIEFSPKKVPNIEISPGFLLIKEGNGVSNMFCKFQDNTMKIFFKMAT